MTGSGDKAYNFYKGVTTGHTLMKAGFAPFIPHMSFINESFHTVTWEEWLEYDETWIAVSDAIFRIKGKSPGAEREVKFARKRQIPIFTSLRSIKRWKREKFDTPSGLGLSKKRVGANTGDGLVEEAINSVERISE